MIPAPESARITLDRAWGRIPHSRETTAGLRSFTRLRVERIISLAIGLGSLALGVQAFLAALGSEQELSGWKLPLMILAFLPLAGMLIGCALGRAAAPLAAAFAVAYLATLILWPLAAQPIPSGETVHATSPPWIWYLVTVATAAAILAFPLPLQIVWTAVIPILYGLTRLVEGGSAVDFWISLGLDVSFALILGGIIVTLGWVFRGSAENVDETRAQAVESYARAAAAAAGEQERVAVAALMHDSVLAALIAVERAHTPRERALATAMAREALTRLANTEQDPEEGSDEPRHLHELADEIEGAAFELGIGVAVERIIDPRASAVPGRVGRALVLAATQAISNAHQHAGAAGLSVSVHGAPDPLRIDIAVRDSGAGFDIERIAHDRLGIRASILARVAAVGGSSAIDSGSDGTTVRVGWTEVAP